MLSTRMEKKPIELTFVLSGLVLVHSFVALKLVMIDRYECEYKLGNILDCSNRNIYQIAGFPESVAGTTDL